MSEVLQEGREGAAGDVSRDSAHPKVQEGLPGKEDSPPADQDEQYKYHQQMLYPVPGLRNYGFSDTFMMHIFKVEPCRRQEKHARGSCPYAHPGDVAQRRPPEAYQALLCPEVRAKKVCPRANDCQCSHSAFEFWLHPDRYRTSLCEKGERCSRPVCFFAHNEKELRPLPAGLKPAAQTPEETAKRLGSSRPGSMSGTAQLPGDMAGMVAAPMYMHGLAGAAGRQAAMHRPPLPMMAQGYFPGYSQMHAGYSQAPAAYPQAQAGYNQAGYRAVPAPPALDVSMQPGYGAIMGSGYMPQSPLVSPAGGLQPQGVAGSPMLLPGAPGPVAAAAATTTQQFSPVAAGRHSTSSNGSNGGVWQPQQPSPQQQQAGQVPQGRQGPASTTPTAAGMQLPEAVMQQFSHLGVGGGSVSPAYQANNTGIMPAMQMPGVQYAQQQQTVYMQPGTDQGWSQPQPPLLQARHSQTQGYAMAGGPQPVMGRVVPAAAGQGSPSGLLPPSQQHLAAGAAFGMQGESALTQQWGAGGGDMRQPNPNGHLMGGTSGLHGAQSSYSGHGGW